MRPELQELCNLFIQNRDVVKDNFFWESSNFYPIAASIFTDKRIHAREDRLQFCKSIIERETGFLSSFRDYAKLSVISMMAIDDHPEQRLRKGLNVYDKLKDYFWGSSYLPIAAMIIADMVEPERYIELAARTRNIYELMKSEHPFLTSSEDSVFAAMLALSPLTDEQVVDETEKCFTILKKEFFSGNAVQSLSHVLALCDGAAEEKCKKTMDLYNSLKACDFKYGTSYELATLGVLAMLPVDRVTLINEFSEVDAFLAKQEGYGFWSSITKRERYMHAAMIITSSYMDECQNAGVGAMNTAAISGTISMVAAQQAAMCAAIAASSAAASASANS